MHNNTSKICWNKALTFGVGSIQLSFRIYHCVHAPNTCKYATFQSNCAEGLHFSAFICTVMNSKIVHILQSFLIQLKNAGLINEH